MYNMENNVWTEKKMKTSDKRRWHQCVHIDSELIVVGGIRVDVRSTFQDSSVNPCYNLNSFLNFSIFFFQAFPDNMLVMLTSPKSLFR